MLRGSPAFLARGSAGKEGPPGHEGKEGPPGTSALATVPSGQSESGDYAASDFDAASVIATAISFPVPLATRIPSANVVYVTSSSAAHCSGAGHAEAGFLCIYSRSRKDIDLVPEVEQFEEGAITSGSGRFGFYMQALVTTEGEQAFDIGSYTVTAP